jgi:hypothetical protein
MRGGEKDLCIHVSLQGRILCDQFLIRYVSSCQILDYWQNRPAVTTSIAYGTVTEAKKQAYAAYKQAKKQSPDTVEGWKKELNRIDKMQEKLKKAIQRLEFACNEPYPFSDYFYWSGFTCQGLR